LVAHCTGIEEVMGWNPVQAEFFSGFNFTTAYIVSITAHPSVTDPVEPLSLPRFREKSLGWPNSHWVGLVYD